MDKNAMEDYAIRLAQVLIYRKHINESDYPEELERLLGKYLESPTDEVLDMIEGEFTIATIKEASFQAGAMYGEMNTINGKIRQFCIRHKIGWLYSKPLITICIVLSLAFVYNTFFRYHYKIYKNSFYGAEIIKLDTLTGKSTKSYPEYVQSSKQSKTETTQSTYNLLDGYKEEQGGFDLEKYYNDKYGSKAKQSKH